MLALIFFTDLVVLGAFGYGFVHQIILGQQFGNKPPSDGFLIFATVTAVIFCVSLTLLFLKSRLETEVRQDGIYYRFFPFINKFRKIDPGSLKYAKVRIYHPITEFGGWGIRFSLSGNGVAYTVSGNLGLQLELKNGNKILLGSQKPDEFRSVLYQIFKILE